jgi:hypothetical protein
VTITLITAITALATLAGGLVWTLKRKCVDLAQEEALSTTQTRILLDRSPRPVRRRSMLDRDERWY